MAPKGQPLTALRTRSSIEGKRAVPSTLRLPPSSRPASASGPLPGPAALGFGLVFHLTWMVIALATLRRQKAVGLPHRVAGPDRLLDLAGGHSGRA